MYKSLIYNIYAINNIVELGHAFSWLLVACGVACEAACEVAAEAASAAASASLQHQLH